MVFFFVCKPEVLRMKMASCLDWELIKKVKFFLEGLIPFGEVAMVPHDPQYCSWLGAWLRNLVWWWFAATTDACGPACPSVPQMEGKSKSKCMCCHLAGCFARGQPPTCKGLCEHLFLGMSLLVMAPWLLSLNGDIVKHRATGREWS